MSKLGPKTVWALAYLPGGDPATPNPLPLTFGVSMWCTGIASFKTLCVQALIEYEIVK
jgi:hypothetical protein